MRQQIDKIKTWCKEHPTVVEEIKLTGLCVGSAVVSTLVLDKLMGPNKHEKALLDCIESYGKTRKEKNQIIEEILEASGDSLHMENHMFGKCGMTIGELGKRLEEYFIDKGCDLNTEVTGLVLFDKRQKPL